MTKTQKMEKNESTEPQVEVPQKLQEKIAKIQQEIQEGTAKGRRGRRGFMLNYQDVKGYMAAGGRTLELGDLKVNLRKYELSKDEIAEITAEAAASGQAFPNPYTRSGAYYAGVQALIDLSPDKWHKMPEIYNRMRSIMSKNKGVRGMTSWQIFCNRGECGNKESGKKVTEKISANYAVLQRVRDLNAYGFKLAQFGAAIIIKIVGTGKDSHKEYMLKTGFKSVRDVKPEVIREAAPKRVRASKSKASKGESVKTESVTVSEPLVLASA